MSNFANIALASLEAVTGGADAAPNTEETRGKGNIGVTVRGTQVGVQGEYEDRSTRTDAAQCANDIRRAGGSPADILSCYGKQ